MHREGPRGAHLWPPMPIVLAHRQPCDFRNHCRAGVLQPYLLWVPLSLETGLGASSFSPSIPSRQPPSPVNSVSGYFSPGTMVCLWEVVTAYSCLPWLLVCGKVHKTLWDCPLSPPTSPSLIPLAFKVAAIPNYVFLLIVS